MFLEDIAGQLKEHAARFDLENRAIACCKIYLGNYLKSEPEEVRCHLRGLAVEDLTFRFVKHELVFGSWRRWPHILSRVTFGSYNEGYVLDVEPFGYYDLETVEDGEINDDWFWWEQMRDEEGKLTELSRVST